MKKRIVIQGVSLLENFVYNVRKQAWPEYAERYVMAAP